MKEFVLIMIILISAVILNSYSIDTSNDTVYDIELPTIDIIENKIYYVYATAYHPVAAQTDSSPLITADNSRINPNNPMGHRWIGISPDMLGTLFNFGDTVLITNTHYERNGHVYRDSSVFDGMWIVHDIMNARWKMRIDFLIGLQDPLISQDSIKIQKYMRN